MANRAKAVDAISFHATNAEKTIRREVENQWRRGDLADYQPTTLTDTGMEVFATLANGIPDYILSQVDGYTLETLANAIDMQYRCTERIHAEGETLVDDKGNERPHPCVAIEKNYSEMARKYLIELGLTPSARAKIAADAAAQASKSKTIRDILNGS